MFPPVATAPGAALPVMFVLPCGTNGPYVEPPPPGAVSGPKVVLPPEPPLFVIGEPAPAAPPAPMVYESGNVRVLTSISVTAALPPAPPPDAEN